jgi:transposase InsO family protein
LLVTSSGPLRPPRTRNSPERIRVIHRGTSGTYGSPRVTVELRACGIPINHKRVERLMREAGIVGVHLRRRRRTTIPDPAAVAAPDLLGRDFTAAAPDQRWVGDIERHEALSDREEVRGLLRRVVAAAW